MSRRLAREAALRTLYQIELGHSGLDNAFLYNAEELNLDDQESQFAKQLCSGTLQYLEELDRLLSEYAIDWAVGRMPYVDRNILRMALFEILYLEETPASVAVNEAVELAKTYGDINSGRFINGILGSFLRNENKP
jgi:N utilization substance protein B